ncbi:MAG TPA: ABC-F family ATP-binding cassette domain-containing protein [Bryobacteraceae bacterium]|jgi:ATP-binding cassette subfamily F protein 3|nr:ABC-F family ATP-binding cassette domain-containing protein [Bryobacteraceae bacterium]
MLQLTGAGKRFGHKLLFDDLNWLITPKERAGLVGGNGTGKSTLLKVIGGLEPLDYGSISSMKGIRLGYLPQDGLSVSGRTVFAECMDVFAGLKQIEEELETLTGLMSDLDPAGEEYRIVSERFERADAEFRARDGYAIEAQVGSVLAGLGFRKEDWTRRTEEFSGGWQMRIALAKLLLEKPNVLLLDEPTNHLDLEARNWLEDYLTHYEYAYILISHDRYFLDVTVTKTVEIWNKKVHFYSGNYEKYRQQKAERLVQLEAAYKNQQEKIQQLEAFINRFRYQATKAKQVQSRIKELEKIERIELPPEEKTIHFTFPQPKPSGRVVAEFKKVSKSYGPKLVFSDVNFTIERGDRIALVGVNGAGKSTLIKLLAGTEPLSSGVYTLGHNVEVDYFAQDQYKQLDIDSRVLDDLKSAAPRSTETELRSLLGCFLFSEDDVFKRIGVLSGGERNRYALARMLLRPSNFLLLDEPTNHLDMRAKDVLLESLQSYTGTVVFVSHDRYFLENVANRVFEIGDGAVHVFPGNYADYVWRKEGGHEQTPTLKDVLIGVPRAQPIPMPTPPQQPGKRINPLKLKQMQERAQALEARIAELEQSIQASELSLSDFTTAAEATRVSLALESQRAELDRTMNEWEKVTAEIEAPA